MLNVLDKKPQTLRDCHPVALLTALIVAPCLPSSSLSTVAALVVLFVPAACGFLPELSTDELFDWVILVSIASCQRHLLLSPNRASKAGWKRPSPMLAWVLKSSGSFAVYERE